LGRKEGWWEGGREGEREHICSRKQKIDGVCKYGEWECGTFFLSNAVPSERWRLEKVVLLGGRPSCRSHATNDREATANTMQMRQSAASTIFVRFVVCVKVPDFVCGFAYLLFTASTLTTY
jgi:hypothetical protein